MLSDTVSQQNDTINNLASALSNVHSSCDEIKSSFPYAASGYYAMISPSYSNVQYIYCHMDMLCGTDGPWTRIAHLNMTGSLENCPNNFQLFESNGLRGCGRKSNSGSSCNSIEFSSSNYSQVCGRLLRYQHGSPDAIADTHMGLSIIT